MSEWKKVKLGEIASTIQTGPFGSQLHQSDYSDEGTPVVMPKDIVNGCISETSIEYGVMRHKGAVSFCISSCTTSLFAERNSRW